VGAVCRAEQRSASFSVNLFANHASILVSSQADDADDESKGWRRKEIIMFFQRRAMNQIPRNGWRLAKSCPQVSIVRPPRL
jgi:hypothetical protein